MYKFHYDYFLNNFNTILLFTDTDGFFSEIKGCNVYNQCYKDKHLFDFSGYPKNRIYYDEMNRKALGKMKHEVNGDKIDEFVGLKSNW